MKKILIILPLFLLLSAGCGAVKQHWADFTAYYNTFYNARQHFDAGIRENHARRPSFNPHQLIRIHPPPSSAGRPDFEAAIEKSSSILRNHSRSRFVDDAIGMIGISWFYMQEYFAARDKFRELYYTTGDPLKREQAVIWEGRTWLELGLHNEGVRFMEEELQSADEWSRTGLAEARAVLAQLHTRQENLFQAGYQLLIALDDFEDGGLRARAWFHYGQIMERLGNTEQAIRVFTEIPGMQPGYELEFHSLLKEVEMLRRRGSIGEAEARALRLLQDERHYERRGEIELEIAAIEAEKNNFDEAVRRYKRIIRPERAASGSPELTARSYYRLAELYRTRLGDFMKASAYYDSAAAVPADRSLLPESGNLEQMASAFGEYAGIRNRISHLDSLLTLARLPREQFEERIRQLEQEPDPEGALQTPPDAGVPAAPVPAAGEEPEITTGAEGTGFLNIHEPGRLTEAGLQFQAIWGERPLADDWRRRRAGTEDGGEEPAGEVSGLAAGTDREADAGDPEVRRSRPGDLLAEIPFEAAARDSAEAEIHRLHFDLGMVFLLNLEMPDSAARHFEKVFLEGPETAPKASALYALGDLALQQQNEEEALRWARILIDRYPRSRQASQMARRTGLPMNTDPDLQ